MESIGQTQLDTVLKALGELAPNQDELLAAARWTITHDPSTGFQSLLLDMLGDLGVEEADAGLG